MKILHILDHSLPLHSGYTFRSQSIFRAQRARGWKPVIVTSPKHEQSWKGAPVRREQIGTFRYYRSGQGVETRVPILSELLLMATLGQRIAEVAALEKPDLLHAHSPVLNALPALRIGRQLGIPVVYEIRAFWEDAAVDHGSCAENSPRYRLTRALETWACRRADHVAILCDGLKQDLIGRGIPEGKITPVFNGIDPEDFKPSAPDGQSLRQWQLAGKTVFGFIGSFYRYEGLDLLVRAFAEVCRNRSEVVLLLVGGGEMEEALRQLITELGIAERVIMPGRIPQERIPGIYALVDFLVYPRYPMRLTELVTPLKPLEAMAMGKVVIASDVGGHRELLRHGETGLLFPAGRLESLALAMRRVLLEPERCAAIREKALQWVVARHSWQETTSVYGDIYAKARLCGRQNGSVNIKRLAAQGEK